MVVMDSGLALRAPRNDGWRASLLLLLISLRRRRIHRLRRGRETHEACFILGVACDCWRPWPVKTFWPDGVNCKSVAGAAERDGALPLQAIAVDHRRAAGRWGLPRRHHQRRALAIVRQRVRRKRQRNEAAIGQLCHATRLIACNA